MPSPTTSIKLGDKVRDMITGFEGIAVSRHIYLHGCSRIGIQPPGLKDGIPIAAMSFDEQQIKLVEERDVPDSKIHQAGAGGPQNDPI